MTKTNKSLLTVILAILCSVLIAMGVGFSQPVVYAEDGTALENATFVMDGPEVRVDGNNGMRFMAKMSKTDYEKVVGAYDSVEFGVIIMPEYYLGLAGVGAIDYESVFGANAKFAWDMDTAFDGAKYNVIHMNSNASEYDETTMSVKGSVVEMKPENLATAYVANVYAKATKGDVVEYKFATMAEENSSMLEVAFKAINSGLFDNTNAYDTLNGYKTQYEEYKGGEATYSYTVNYVANGETIKSDKVDGIAMNTAVEAEIVLPDGYVLDTSKESVTKGHIYASDIELTVYVKVKEVIDLTAQSVGGTIGLVGSACDETIQKLELPVDIGALKGNRDAIIIHLNDTGWDFPIWAEGYNAETKMISVTTDSIYSAFHGKVGAGVYNVTIKGADNDYKAKVEYLGPFKQLVVLETAQDFVEKFNTSWFDNRANGGREYDYYSYVLYNDIVLDNSSANVEYSVSVHNRYDGVIDGRGHKLENIRISTVWQGLINYKFSGVIKNIAFINIYNAGGNGLISYMTDGGTLENVYISGYSSRESISSNITSNGITVKNVVYNFDDGYNTAGSTQHGYDGEVGSEYITETDVYIAFGNANFFSDNAGKKFGNFEVTSTGLYFCGRLIYGN